MHPSEHQISDPDPLLHAQTKDVAFLGKVNNQAVVCSHIPSLLSCFPLVYYDERGKREGEGEIPGLAPVLVLPAPGTSIHPASGTGV